MRSEIKNAISPACFLSAMLLALNCFSTAAETTNIIEISASRNTSSKIKTVFVKDGELTKAEIIQAIKLASQNGLTNAAEISTFYFFPGGKGISVKSSELHEGRNTRFETVYINKLGWSPIMTNSETKLTGKFWVDDAGKVLTLLRDYKSTNGQPFQVSIGKSVDVELADRVVDLFVADKLQFRKNIAEDNVLRRHLIGHGDVMPKLIHKRDSENDYEMELDNYPTTVIRFTFEKGKITVTGMSEYFI
jgi:hypothetical protein